MASLAFDLFAFANKVRPNARGLWTNILLVTNAAILIARHDRLHEVLTWVWDGVTGAGVGFRKMNLYMKERRVCKDKQYLVSTQAGPVFEPRREPLSVSRL